MMFVRFFTFASMLVATNAHLYLRSPTPMQGNAIKDPLLADGSNFPCHAVSIPTSGGTQMAAGSTQKLIFEDGGGADTAVHGGGSCQVSITYESDPAKVKDPKNWYVIYSIEGGCPSTTLGNLVNSTQCSTPDSVDCLHQFPFEIPKGVKSGQATLAWTWFNTVGNREMYMNCVNADFTDGDGSEMSSFPNMFVANLASLGSCGTTESMYVGFPDPGKYVTTVLPSGAPSSDIYPISTMCAGSSGSSGGNSAPGGSPSANSVQATATSSAASGGMPSGNSAGAPSYGSNGLPTSSGGVLSSAASVASSATTSNVNAPVTLTTMMTVTGSARGVASPSAPAAAPPNAGTGTGAGNTSPGKSSGTSSGSCANGAVTCSSPGSTVCIGTTQFGTCDINNCAIPRPLAPGTSCSDGVIGAAVRGRSEPCHSSAVQNGVFSMRRASR